MMNRKNLKKYEIFGRFKVTRNEKERTWSVYTMEGEFLSTVDDGELNAELELLETEF